MSASRGTNTNIIFIALLFAYALLFAIYVDCFYDVSPFASQFIHIVPLLTWLARLFFTSPLGHDLDQALDLRARAEKRAQRTVPVLRRSFLALGMAAQIACLVYDVFTLLFFFSCDEPDCSPWTAHGFGAVLVLLMALNVALVAAAAALWRHSSDPFDYPQSWKAAWRKDHLLAVRVCVRAPRLVVVVCAVLGLPTKASWEDWGLTGFVFALLGLPTKVSWGDWALAGLVGAWDVEWLFLVVLQDYKNREYEAKICTAVQQAAPGAIYYLTADARDDRIQFRVLNWLHFVLNGSALAVLCLKSWAYPSAVLSALQILTVGVIFFTAHDRFGLQAPIENCTVPKLPLSRVLAVPAKMKPMKVESSYTMRARLQKFKLKF